MDKMYVDAYGRFTPAQMQALKDYSRVKGLSFASTLRLFVAERLEKEIAVIEKRLAEGLRPEPRRGKKK